MGRDLGINLAQEVGDCVRCVDLEDEEAADRVRVYESVRFSCDSG